MWTKSYSIRVKGLTRDPVWKMWTDVNQWHTWQDDIDYAKLESSFEKGAYIRFKPKGGPKLRLEITEVKPGFVFIDCTSLPLAKMYDAHELIDHDNELEIKSTISIKGPLSFLWRKIIAENVANGLEEQTKKLINKVQNG